MKKNKITLKFILILFITIWLYYIIKPIRTMSVMECIAKDKLMDDGPLKLFSGNHKPIYQEIEGPIVTDRKERVEFTWYKILEWGDTAHISAFVYKNFLRDLNFMGLLFEGDTEPADVTADIKWYYVYVPEGISKFIDILPNQYKNKSIELSEFKLYSQQTNKADSIIFIINPDRLFYFLQKGHFQIVEKNNNYAIVDFYQPIANIINKHTNDTISTMSAKVFFNDSLEVFILPQIIQE